MGTRTLLLLIAVLDGLAALFLAINGAPGIGLVFACLSSVLLIRLDVRIDQILGRIK